MLYHDGVCRDRRFARPPSTTAVFPRTSRGPSALRAEWVACFVHALRQHSGLCHEILAHLTELMVSLAPEATEGERL